jgi:hypothetical protein
MPPAFDGPELLALSEELGIHIASHLGLRSLCQLMPACRTLRDWGTAALAREETLDLAPRKLTPRLAAECLEWAGARMPALARVILTHITLRPESLGYLPPSVTSIDLSGSIVSVRAVQLLAQSCPRLRELLLRSCPVANADALAVAVAERCRALRAVSFSGTASLTQLGVRALSELKDLERVGLHGCVRVPVHSIAMLSRCSQLVALDVGSMPSLSDDALREVVRRALGLQWLSIGSAQAVSDSLLRLIGQCCRALERLVCSGCPRITRAGLTAVCIGCPRLSWLHAKLCLAVDEQCLEVIASHCPLIVSLDVRGCPAVTTAGMECFFSVRRERHPHLDPRHISILADDEVASYAAMAAALKPRRHATGDSTDRLVVVARLGPRTG